MPSRGGAGEGPRVPDAGSSFRRFPLSRSIVGLLTIPPASISSSAVSTQYLTLPIHFLCHVQALGSKLGHRLKTTNFRFSGMSSILSFMLGISPRQ